MNLVYDTLDDDTLVDDTLVDDTLKRRAFNITLDINSYSLTLFLTIQSKNQTGRGERI